MPERMIRAFREPDDLSACIDKLEHKLHSKRYFSRSKRKDDEATLGFLKKLKKLGSAPMLRTLTIDDFILAQYDIIRIVGEGKSVTVFNTEYGNRRDFIYTLEDCLQAAIKMIIPEKIDEAMLHFFVIASNPQKGIVLEYGNHGPKFEQIGVTCGYA